jgi:hypothetical protein
MGFKVNAEVQKDDWRKWNSQMLDLPIIQSSYEVLRQLSPA